MKNSTRGTWIGLLFLMVLALGMTSLAQLPLFLDLRLSPLVLGIVFGMLLANTLRPHFPRDWDASFRIAGKQFLRAGIVFYGFRITLDTLFQVGIEAIIIDCCIVCGTLILGNYLGRFLGLDRDERLLISSGSAICGAAAVLATEPVLKAKSHKTVIAVATVVLFGTLSMFLYPVLYRTGMLSALSERGIGIYTGATIHEVAHVVGAGAAMGGELASTATITKMIRVILLAPMLLGLSYWVRPRGQVSKNASTQGKIQVPWFAFYFVGVVLLHSVFFRLSAGQGWSETYQRITETIQWLDNLALTMAMMAIGLDATFAKFKQSGAKPFLLALGLYVWLVVGGYALTYLLV